MASVDWPTHNGKPLPFFQSDAPKLTREQIRAHVSAVVDSWDYAQRHRENARRVRAIGGDPYLLTAAESAEQLAKLWERFARRHATDAGVNARAPLGAVVESFRALLAKLEE